MEIAQTPIAGVLLIKPKVWGDQRGYFVETWQQQRYEAAGIDLPFVQDNHSMSTYGILRGLHFQKSRPQGKLVSVSLGSIIRKRALRANWSMFHRAVFLMWLWTFGKIPPRLASGLV